MYISPLINDAWKVIRRMRAGDATIIDMANGQLLAWMIKDALEKEEVDDALPFTTAFLGREVIKEMEEQTRVQNN